MSCDSHIDRGPTTLDWWMPFVIDAYISIKFHLICSDLLIDLLSE